MLFDELNDIFSSFYFVLTSANILLVLQDLTFYNKGKTLYYHLFSLKLSISVQIFAAERFCDFKMNATHVIKPGYWDVFRLLMS